MTGYTKPADIGGYVGLAAAILGRAVIDAQRGDTSAAAWLMWGDGRNIAELAGVDCDYWQAAIMQRITGDPIQHAGATARFR